MNDKLLKCTKCGWLHMPVTHLEASEQGVDIKDISKCFSCSAPYTIAEVVSADTAPIGVTIQPLLYEPKTTVRKVSYHNIEDGRENIIVTLNGATMTIEDKVYKHFGASYEDMKTTTGLAAFFECMRNVFVEAAIEEHKRNKHGTPKTTDKTDHSGTQSDSLQS